MLKSLKIKNFRCLEEFELPQLGRVNLLVGKNNSGKTSILEAVDILTSHSIQPLHDILQRRQEYGNNEKDRNNISFEFRHLVHGHPEISLNSTLFEVLGTDNKDKKINFSAYSTTTTTTPVGATSRL